MPIYNNERLLLKININDKRNYYMKVRIKERDLWVPALNAASNKKNGEIETSDLINELEGHFQPDGQDNEVLDGRNDTKFTQKVRNLISHRDQPSSMFSKGYAEYTGNGIRLTDSGRKFIS